jgi:drug/metabolite transporter (DMT)-like permease
VARRRVLLYFLVLVVTGLWGGSFVITKVALDAMGPMALAFWRWLISALALVLWLASRRRLDVAARLVREQWVRLGWMSFAGIALYYALENIALQFTTVVNAGILANLTTIFMALLAIVMLQEHQTLAEWIAMLVAFAGAALVSQGAGHFSISAPGLRGDLLMSVAGVFGALYSLGGTQLVRAGYSSDVVTAVVASLGALMLLPVALLEGLTLVIPLNTWLAVVLLGLGAGAISNLGWFAMLRRMTTSSAGMTLFIVPIVSTALAVTILHEPITPLVGVGAVLVLVGVAVTQRTRPEAESHA